MAAPNTSPVYSLTPKVGRVNITTGANVKSNGDGTIATDIWLAYTAGANGAWISKIRFNPVATVAATNTAATTLRAFISSKTSGATVGSTDTFLLAELSAGVAAADHSTNAVTSIEIPCNFALDPNHTILVSAHVANVANTSWQATVYGGDF